MHVHRRHTGRLLALLSIAGVTMIGCGGDAGSEEGAPEQASNEVVVYSLALDPADGSLFIANGAGFFRLEKGAKTAKAITPTLTSPLGKGPIRDLVLRATGPGTFVASGHAVEPPLPTNIGFARSADAGKSWESLSGQDKEDYHEIEISGRRIVALGLDGVSIQVSDDDGRTFENFESPAASPPIDVAVNPADPSHWAVSNKSGTFVSTNSGRSWRQRNASSSPRLAWPASDDLYGVGLDGRVRHSPDGGQTWTEKGTLDAAPKELIAGPTGELYAVTSGGRVHVSDDGGASWRVLTTVS